MIKIRTWFRWALIVATSVALGACTQPQAESETDENPDGVGSVGIDQKALTGPTCNGTSAGWYCGNDLMTNAVATTVYKCSGAVGTAPTTSQACFNGCLKVSGQNDYCKSESTVGSLKATKGNMAVLQNAIWASTASPYLPWSSGQQISAPSGFIPSQLTIGTFAGTKLGDGQCVSFVKAVTSTPTLLASKWKQGIKVVGGGLPIGTAVATFKNGVYDSGHAGILAGYSGTDGFYLYDQNFVGGQGALRGAKHKVSTSGTGVGNANSYYAILW